MKIRSSLKIKLFIVIAGILVFNILLSLFLGNVFFEKLYTYDKINNLKLGVDKIKNLYISQNLDETAQNIIKYESENINICIFNLTSKNTIAEIEYFSKNNYSSSNILDNEIIWTIQALYTENAFNNLYNSNYYIKIDENNDFDNNISILSSISKNKYILMQTPIKFIKDISDLSMKYSLYISIFSFAIGAIVLYFIADNATKPIRKIQIIANKISNLDFSDTCNILSNDEIGLLSESINNMSNKLQDFISQIMIANENLKNDLYKQEKADNMRKQLIANISHDLKTPLTLILSYSEAMIDIKNIDESTKNEYLNIIINEGNKMSSFVQDILKLSQLESGIVPLKKTNFSIHSVIDEIIRKNLIISKEKSLKIELFIPEDLIVFADYYKIEQVFQNLYENAIKYSNLNGDIKISSEKLMDKCIIKIFNTGNNIDENEIDNLFISFYRSDTSRKNINSYGLGLAIVKAILEMHNLNFGVTNNPKGVEFWFEIELSNFEDC